MKYVKGESQQITVFSVYVKSIFGNQNCFCRHVAGKNLVSLT